MASFLLLLMIQKKDYAHAFLTGSSLGFVNSRRFGSKHRSKVSTTMASVPFQLTEDEFMKWQADKERIELLSNVPLFEDLNDGDIARLATLAISLHVEAGDNIFKQGDSSDGAFLVLSGTFETYDESNENIITSSFSRGDLFGELGPLMNQKRAFSVRESSNSGSSVLKLKKTDLNLAMSSAKVNVETVLEREYEDYFNSKKRAAALKKCPIFKGLLPNDLNRIAAAMELKKYKKNDLIFLQGDDGDDMYFVKSGNFACIDEQQPSDITVANIKEKGFFGELAILLNKKRSLTVKATEDGEVWRLSKEDFLNCVQESNLLEVAVESLKKSYGLESIWDILLKVSPAELFDLWFAYSRPKKSLVSKHSLLATVATGFYLAALLPMFSPGVYTNGAPRIYDQLLFDNESITRIASFLLAVVGGTGVFRLPPNVTKIRKLWFKLGAWLSIFLWMTNDSNLYIGSSQYTFDLMQTAPALAYIAVTSFLMINKYQIAVETITCPRKDLDDVIFPNRFAGILVAFLMYIGFTFVFPMVFLSRDPDLFESVYTPGINAIRGVELTTPLLLNGFIGFGTLIATLLFEKKVTNLQAQVLFIVNFFLSGFYDTVVAIFDPDIYSLPDESQRQLYLAQYDLVSKAYNEFHALEFTLALGIVSVAIGLANRFREGKLTKGRI